MIKKRFCFYFIAALILAISCDELLGVDSVMLDREAVTLSVGETVLLEASVIPATSFAKENLVWSSSQVSVASVDSTGFVMALTEGVSMITASVGTKSASCVVTVTADKIEVTSIKLDKDKLVLAEGGSEVIVATVFPEEAVGRVLQWSSSDESVATVKNGTVTAVKVGTALITAGIDDVSATCSVTVVEEGTNDDLGGGEHEGTTEEDIIN